jgi:zinc transport system permease protein
MFIEMLTYPFMQRALICGTLIALCSALLGVCLVLKRYSMIGDGLSHVSFGAMSIASAVGLAPLGFAIPVVMAAAVFLLRISERKKIKGDSAIALISTASLAVGVTVTTFSQNSNIDLSGYMFGSILAIKSEDLILSIILSLVVVISFIVFYNRIFAVTFDENFAASAGIKVGYYNMLIAMLTAVTVVLGMRLTGALLISALIIFPPMSAMRVCRSFRAVVIVSAVISVVCFNVGLIASYFLATPAGASVVLVNIIVFAVFSLAAKIKSK